MYRIYFIQNIINSKFYIGQTSQSLTRRFLDHCRKQSNCHLLKNAIKKYGSENFKIIELDNANTQKEADSKEIFWIKELKSLVPSGYNLKTGGSAGKHHEITKKKIGRASIGNQYNKGRKLTNQHKSQISKSLTGHKRNRDEILKTLSTKGCRSFSVYTLSGEYVGTWDVQTECAKELNIKVKRIGECLNGKGKYHKGYTFKFEDKLCQKH